MMCDYFNDIDTSTLLAFTYMFQPTESDFDYTLQKFKITRLESTWSSEKGLNLNVERNWS